MLATTLALATTAAGTLGPSQPNVVFIVIDDLGHDDVGFRSNEIKTPVIDGLAAAGLVLENYYVQDVCSPSRATFMTGRYSMHNTIVDWIPPASAYGLPLNETTMAQMFAGAGYACHATGKWHLGFYKWGMTPTFRGFESFRGFYSGGEDYFSHTSSGAYDFRLDPSPKCGPGCSQVDSESNGKYSTTVFTTEAVRVVNDHPWKGAAKQPLFLYLAYQGVHAPAQVPDSYVTPYATTIADRKRRTFAGMLSAVDEGIGNVTKALKAHGAFDNTVFVFTADNGGPTTTGDGVGARNWPLRGGKHSIWDGGVKATAFISGTSALLADPFHSTPTSIAFAASDGAPRAYPPVFNGLMHGADWLTTLASVAGYDVSTIPLPLDGVNLWSSFVAAARGEAHISSEGEERTNRTVLVIGNSTNECSWASDDPRYHGAAGIAEAFALGGDVPAPMNNLGCGFAIRTDVQGKRWKLIKGYGGGPNTWCNKSSTGNQCGLPTGHYPWPPHAAVQVPAQANPTTCSMMQGICLPGNDISNFPLKAPASSYEKQCCDACNAEKKCAAFTINTEEGSTGPQCYLKTTSGTKKNKSQKCISGTNGRAPWVPPAPTPAPPAPEGGACPNGWCLYDVLSDPYELHEVSAVPANSGIVSAMQAKMAQILLSYHEYQEDPECQGKTTYANNSVVGKAWQPWC